MIKNILEIVYNFFRGTIRLLVNIFLGLFTRLIWALDFDRENLTKRKVRRVRFFTKLKLILLRYAPHLVSFLGWKAYLEDLRERMNNGLQLRDNRTD